MERSNQPPKPECCRVEGQAQVSDQEAESRTTIGRRTQGDSQAASESRTLLKQFGPETILQRAGGDAVASAEPVASRFYRTTLTAELFWGPSPKPASGRAWTMEGVAAGLLFRLRACLENGLLVAQATRLCRQATCRTERERQFEPMDRAFSLRCPRQFRSAGRRPGRAGRPSTLRSKQALAPVASERATEDGRHSFSKQAKNNFRGIARTHD